MGESLTDEQIGMLNERVDDFWAASYKVREKFVHYFLGRFRKACPPRTESNQLIIATVCTPPITLNCTYKFLAYSAAPLWAGQTGNEEICCQSPKSDGQWKVCMLLLSCWEIQLKTKCTSSQEIALTVKHLSMLRRWILKFRTADVNNQKKIIGKAVDHIKATWTGDVEFNHNTVMNVCELSANLIILNPDILAYSSPSVQSS